MTQYIDKSALVTEMENLVNTYNKCKTRNSYEEGLKNGRLIGYKDALHKINTLEAKDVDLEKEIQTLWSLNQKSVDSLFIPMNYNGLRGIAKHFFELGMAVGNKAQKGE